MAHYLREGGSEQSQVLQKVSGPFNPVNQFDPHGFPLEAGSEGLEFTWGLGFPGNGASWEQLCLRGENGGERGLSKVLSQELWGQPGMEMCPGATGPRSRRKPGVGTAADGMHVQGGDLLPDDAPPEGPGGRTGEEVQEGGDTGHRGWSQ